MKLFENITERMTTKNYKFMNTIYKLLLVFTMFICSLNGYSQYADPGIGIIIDPISVIQGGTGILSANVGNYGNSTIEANSLMVTISVGPNSEIIGIATGGDSRWTQFSLTPGSGNTIILKNTLGSFDSFDIGYVLLTIRGNTVSDLDLITSNIGYVSVGNLQGNESNTNDYSQTSLIITPPTCTTPNLTVSGAVCNGATYQVSFNSNGNVTASAGTVSGNTVSGIAIGINLVLTSTSINGCESTQTTVLSPSSCVNPPIGCTPPTISAGNGVCSGTGMYSVSVTASSGAIISSTSGIVSGNSVTGIPLGTAVTITATSASCTNSVTVSSPTDCTTPCALTAVSYSVGSCTSFTYNVSVTNPSVATITASAGTVTPTEIINIPVETNVTITATIPGCTAQVITLSAPVCCNLNIPLLSVVTQPTCSVATGSFTITNYNAAYTYAVTPSTGVVIVGTTVTAPAGTYTVTASSGSCASIASAPVVINAQPATLVTPTLSIVTQPTCSVATGSFTITNYNAAYTYAVTPSTGVVIVGTTVTAPSGTYTVTASSGSCTSIASASVVINAQPATLVTPTLSVVTQPTCSVATGSFTIINYNAAYTYAVNPSTGVTIVGNTVTAPAGSYTVTASLGACTSQASSPAFINAQPTTLVTPTLSVVTQPTCSVATGSFTITNYNATYTYAVNPSTGVTIVGNTVTAPAGTYTVTASSGSCASIASAPVVINEFNNSSCASIALIKTAHLDDLNHDGFAQVGEKIIYTFVITNTGLVPLTNITINDPLPGVVMSGGPISLGIGGVDSTSFTGVYTITTQDVINESVTNQATVYGTSPTGGIVNDLSDSTSITGDNGTVLPIKACKVDVFNAVTPNNDGNNDYLFIKGLDCYNDNSIEIYNRWGVKVYETQGYDNSTRAFRGYSEGRVTINKSEPLPYGTYYYILKYKDYTGNSLTKTGFLYLTL